VRRNRRTAQDRETGIETHKDFDKDMDKKPYKKA
jgi:hypothetical protein